MKISDYWSDVNSWRCMDYKTGCTVLDSLKFADQVLGETSQERELQQTVRKSTREITRVFVASSVR